MGHHHGQGTEAQHSCEGYRVEDEGVCWCANFSKTYSGSPVSGESVGTAGHDVGVGTSTALLATQRAGVGCSTQLTPLGTGAVEVGLTGGVTGTRSVRG